MSTKSKEFAAMLNGREYGQEISKQECQIAKVEGLIVAFGYSDDNLELRGMCDDEVSAYGGCKSGIRIDKMEPVTDECCRDCLKREGVIDIEAKWCPKGLDASWLITSSLPSDSFDIMEDGSLFCRGLVIDVEEAKAALKALDQVGKEDGKAGEG